MRVKRMFRQLRQQMSKAQPSSTSQLDDEVYMMDAEQQQRKRQLEVEADMARIRTLLDAAPKSLILSRQRAIDPESCTNCCVSLRRNRLSIISESVPASSRMCSMHRQRSLPHTASMSSTLRKTPLHRRHSSVNDLPFNFESSSKAKTSRFSVGVNSHSRRTAKSKSDTQLQTVSYCVDMNDSSDASIESIFASVQVKRSRSFGSSLKRKQDNSKLSASQQRSLTPNSLNSEDIALYRTQSLVVVKSADAKLSKPLWCGSQSTLAMTRRKSAADISETASHLVC